MTYLTPDDWYANHGLAPGDARLPQTPLQPTPGNLAATPPMRGYFGPRPPIPTLYAGPAKTVSPLAVSDVMWGVHGLGALGAGIPHRKHQRVQHLAALPPPGIQCACGAQQIGTTRDGWCVCQRGHQYVPAAPAPPPRGMSGLGLGAVPGPLTASAAPAAVSLAPSTSLPGVTAAQMADPGLQAAVASGQASAQAAITAAETGPIPADQSQAIIAAAAVKMKDQLMISAAIQSGVGVGIGIGTAILASVMASQFIPIVGQVIGIAYAAIMAVVGTEYEKKAKLVIANVQNQLNQLAAQLTSQYSNAQAALITQETPNAIALLTATPPITCPSGQACSVTVNQLVQQQAAAPAPTSAPINGLGGHIRYQDMSALGNIFSQLWTQVQRAVTSVDVQARRVSNAVVAAAQTADGDAVLKKAQQAAAAAYASASAHMYAIYNQQMAQLQDPVFIHNLDVSMACQFMCDPQYAQLQGVALQKNSATGQVTGAIISAPLIGQGITGSEMLLPAAAAGAATLVVLSI